MTSVTRPETKKLARRKHPNPAKTLLFAAFVFAVLAMSNLANAAGTDPRKCSLYNATPFQCAKANAIHALKTTMAQQQHVARWNAPTFCDQNVTLLKWKCTSFLGGDRWAATVTFRAISSGWRTVVVVKPA